MQIKSKNYEICHDVMTSHSPSTSLLQLLSSPLRSPLTEIDRPVRRGGRARSGGHGQQRRRPGHGIGLLRALARIHSTSPVPRCSRTIRHTSYLSMPRAANPCRKWTQALSSRCTCAGPWGRDARSHRRHQEHRLCRRRHSSDDGSSQGWAASMAGGGVRGYLYQGSVWPCGGRVGADPDGSATSSVAGQQRWQAGGGGGGRPVGVAAADKWGWRIFLVFLYFAKMFAECRFHPWQTFCRVPMKRLTAKRCFAGRSMPWGVCRVYNVLCRVAWHTANDWHPLVWWLMRKGARMMLHE